MCKTKTEEMSGCRIGCEVGLVEKKVEVEVMPKDLFLDRFQVFVSDGFFEIIFIIYLC